MKLFWNFVDLSISSISFFIISVFALFGCCNNPVESDYKRSKEIHGIRGDSTSIIDSTSIPENYILRYNTIPTHGIMIDSSRIVFYHLKEKK